MQNWLAKHMREVHKRYVSAHFLVDVPSFAFQIICIPSLTWHVKLYEQKFQNNAWYYLQWYYAAVGTK